MSTSPEPEPPAAPPLDPAPGPPPEDAVPVAPAAPQRPHAFLVYNLARLAIFAAALGVLYLLSFRGVALVLLALLASGAISVVALFKLRGDATSSLGAAWRRLSDRIDKGAAREDVD